MKKYRRIIKYQLIIIVTILLNYFARPYWGIGGEFLLLPMVMLGEYINRATKTN